LNVRDEFAIELQRQTERLAEFRGNAEELRTEKHGTLQTLRQQDDERDGASPTPHEVSARQIQVEQEMTMLMTENGILGSLDFPSILDRHEDVEIAHSKTFEWIFKDSQVGDKSWNNFVEWLQRGTGLYWINGKAGSGKSTLMKYIYGHSRTREELGKWAGGSPCDVCGFFFWNNGSEEQRSQRGLLRTLLFEILQIHRDLLPSVLPNAWDAWSARARTALKHGTVSSKAAILSRDQKPWTLSHLKSAFRLLVQKCQNRGIKLCFFIDGLDEYGGDLDDIAEYFLEFANEPGIKMCLSSRPLVVFEDAFADYPGLKLQNLTHIDISSYVEDKLESHRHMARLSHSHPDEAAQLVREIVTKASGVFLWVKLVVKSLLQGLRDQNRISDLERRLRHLPADLEALYEHMLERTDSFYLEQASQIFQIVLVAQKESTSHQITLLQLSWAEDEDPSAAISAPLRPLTMEEVTGKCKLMDSRLKSVCSGLLESYESKYSTIAPDARVVFLHRTVSDFFKKPLVWLKITQHTKSTGFSPYLSLLRSSVLQLKTRDGNRSVPLDATVIRDALTYAKKAENDLARAFPELLDQLDAAATYQWRISGGRSINGRLPVKPTVFDDPEESVENSTSLRSPTKRSNYSTSKDVRSSLGLSPSSETLTIGSQPRPIIKFDAMYYDYRSSPSKNLGDLFKPPKDDGSLHYWTYGIEVGSKPLGHALPFYDLARELGLQYYVAHKDKTGIVVDHDVNHHMLMHTVTCYARPEARSRVPDVSVVELALEAGADPNFTFHGSTPWQETLTGALWHISRFEFDEELQDPIHPRGKKWETDSRTWADIMKIFIQHGASLDASSDQHYGQPRRKPLAIVRMFPDSLAPEADELRRLIEHSSAKAPPRDYDVEIQQLEQATTRKQKQSRKIEGPGEEARSVPEVAPAGNSTYSWMVSWLSPTKK